MNKIKVLIVDDSFTVRKALSEVLVTDPDIEVIATAGDAMAAAERIKEQAPDVITLDIEMPHMDGLTFLHMIMCLRPIPVVICSSQASRPKNAMLALEYGAVDIILKPQINVRKFFEEAKVMLCDAVKAAAQARLKIISGSIRPREPELLPDLDLSREPAGDYHGPAEKVVVIGASTGGTEAIRTLLKDLPANAPPVLVVQHMPEHFTHGFAERLAGICAMKVKEAENNDRAVRGQVLIAPGNRHMLLKRNAGGYYVEIKDGPLVSRHRPSVDVLFRSAARYAGESAVGVIMTGMGDDGAAGMKEMKSAGAFTIAQDEASCVVFGMPREAVRHGGVDIVLPLDEIARKVLETCRPPSGTLK